MNPYFLGSSVINRKFYVHIVYSAEAVFHPVSLPIFYEKSFLIVFHNVWSTGPGKVADLIFEFRTRTKVNNLRTDTMPRKRTNSRVLTGHTFPRITRGGNMRYIGIDARKLSESVCVMDKDGKIVESQLPSAIAGACCCPGLVERDATIGWLTAA